MITVSRNPQQAEASDKFIYTTLFLYADSADILIDVMSSDDIDISSLPLAAQDFIQTYYSVENGLRRLLLKSVNNGDYVKALLSVDIPHHYVCIDSQSAEPVNLVSEAVESTNKLFVVSATGQVIDQLPPRKQTYAILEGEYIGTMPFESLVTHKSERILVCQ